MSNECVAEKEIDYHKESEITMKVQKCALAKLIDMLTTRKKTRAIRRQELRKKSATPLIIFVVSA